MQFEFPGALGVADGRYLARMDGEKGERVLVLETIGAPPPPRRRRRAKRAEPGAEPGPVPLTRVTAVRAQEPFDSEAEAGTWLEATLADEGPTDAAIDEGLDLLNRALHAQAVASADPQGAELSAERAATVRIGHGSGKEVAAGRFTAAREVDARAGVSRRSRRDEELRPQERVAAILGGREAALQLRVALEALLVELDGALADPGHEEDMAELKGRKSEAGEAANTALRGDLPVDQEHQVEDLIALCERILRRRRVLRG